MDRKPLVLISGKDVLGTGGHESYVLAHALAAQRAGWEPHIFCVAARRQTLRAEFGTVHHISCQLPGGRPVVLQPPFLAHAVVRFLAGRPGPHLIHGFAIWAAAAVQASRMLGRRGIHAIPIASAYGTRAYEVTAMQEGLEPHHDLAHRFGYRTWLGWIRAVDDAVEGWAYRRSRLVLVNYESVRHILTDAYGSTLAIRRLPYAAPDAFAERAAPGKRTVPEPVARLAAPRAPVILAVARHDPRKGLDRLLLALGEIARTGLPFRACLVGPGRLLAAHRRLAVEQGLGQRVAIPGRVEDVGPYLDCADIFVLPSLAEASGSVSVLEALNAGVALIASACDGIPEDLVDGREALLVTPGNVPSLTVALKALLTDEPRRAELSANALVAHERRFSAKRFVDALANVYREMELSPA